MIIHRAGEGRLIAFRGASIVRKADAADTGGRWAFGEAAQPPAFENSPHSHSEPEAFYVLDGDFVLYGSGEPTDLNRGCFVLIPPGEIPGVPSRRPRRAFSRDLAANDGRLLRGHDRSSGCWIGDSRVDGRDRASSWGHRTRSTPKSEQPVTT
jgi:Cupin domain